MFGSIYFSTSDVGRLFSVTRFTIRNWINSGWLGSVKTLGGHRRILAQHLIEFISNNKSLSNEDIKISVFLIKEMSCYAIKAYVYQTLIELTGIKLVKIETDKKLAVIISNPKKIEKSQIKYILERKMHFSIMEIEMDVYQLDRSLRDHEGE